MSSLLGGYKWKSMTYVKQFDRVLLHPDASFNVSSAHAADMIALVEAIAGIMFFTTPCTYQGETTFTRINNMSETQPLIFFF